MTFQRKHRNVLWASCFLGAAALSACGQDESDFAITPTAEREAALATTDVGLCAYICTERGMPYDFCLSCCQSPACCAAKKLLYCDDPGPLPSRAPATEKAAAPAVVDVSLCAYVCTERGMPYDFCLSCCQNPACCASKKLRFCSEPGPLPEAAPASRSPSLCAEECWSYYLGCIGEAPTPLREHICYQDYLFCLGTWPSCTPPVR